MKLRALPPINIFHKSAEVLGSQYDSVGVLQAEHEIEEHTNAPRHVTGLIWAAVLRDESWSSQVDKCVQIVCEFVIFCLGVFRIYTKELPEQSPQRQSAIAHLSKQS